VPSRNVYSCGRMQHSRADIGVLGILLGACVAALGAADASSPIISQGHTDQDVLSAASSSHRDVAGTAGGQGCLWPPAWQVRAEHMARCSFGCTSGSLIDLRGQASLRCRRRLAGYLTARARKRPVPRLPARVLRLWCRSGYAPGCKDCREEGDQDRGPEVVVIGDESGNEQRERNHPACEQPKRPAVLEAPGRPCPPRWSRRPQRLNRDHSGGDVSGKDSQIRVCPRREGLANPHVELGFA
jgi:hypothetical protein